MASTSTEAVDATMKIGSVDLDHEVLVIAEIGNNHEGSYARAEEMIGLAGKAGAQAVKFQTIVPERLVTADQEARLATLRRFQFSRAQFEGLARTAANNGVMFLSTPFDVDCVEWLAPLVPAFKIASGDNDYTRLLRAVAATGKPVILSTGMAVLDDVAAARDLLRAEWTRLGRGDPGLALLHCVVSYPTPPAEANLAAIAALASLGETVGYSDHTLGIDAAVAAVAMGARVIEKHFTLDKNLSEFRDHKLSADPAELAELVRRVRLIEEMRGRAEKRVMAAEEAALTAIRRGAYAARDLAAGTALGAADVSYLRPRVGLSPMDADRRLGSRLTRPVKAGEALTLEHFR
jgi:N-acetylneuraminate synthase/N,N'-diacetyllegionaminate synthase